MATNVVDGYWGPVDANNTWFEERYVYSPFISEFWNAMTSFVFIVDGLRYLWACHQCGIRFRYRIPYIILVLTGIGSVTFHATSRWWAEVLDEVPMILLMASYTYLSSDSLPGYNANIVHALNAIFATTILTMYLWHHNYEVFVHGFTLYAVYHVIILPSIETLNYSVYNWPMRASTLLAMTVGRIVWETEQRLGVWWLHMVWHFLGSYAGVMGAKAFVIIQCEHYGVKHVSSTLPESSFSFNTILRHFWVSPRPQESLKSKRSRPG